MRPRAWRCTLRKDKQFTQTTRMILQARDVVTCKEGEVPVILGPDGGSDDKIYNWLPSVVMAINFIRCGCPYAMIVSPCRLLQDHQERELQDKRGLLLCDILDCLDNIAPGEFHPVYWRTGVVKIRRIGEK